MTSRTQTASIFEGDDLDEWLAHFRLQTMKGSLEDIGCEQFSDLIDVFSDPIILNDVKGRVPVLTYKKFCSAANLTSEFRNLVPDLSSECMSVVGGGSAVRSSHSLLPPAPPTSSGASVAIISSGAPALPPPAPASAASIGTTSLTGLAAEILRMEADMLRVDAMLARTGVDSTKMKKMKADLAAMLEKTKTKLETVRKDEREIKARVLKTAHRKKLIAQMDSKLRQASSVDLCIAMDCTGSMSSYMSQAATQINTMVTEIAMLIPDVPLRLAFIGYRDHCDGDKRLSVLRFVQDINDFKNFVSGQKATGGGDGPEDVFGALSVAGGLEWRSSTRLFYHVADAPCHGTRFHEWGREEDSHPDGDPNGLQAENLLPALADQNVMYYFGRITRHTDKMMGEFNKIMRRPYVETQDMTNAATMVATMTSTLASTLTATLSGSARPGAHASDMSAIEIDATEPNWSRVASEAATVYAPTSVASMEALTSGAMDGEPTASMISSTIKIAPKPFAKGSCRVAYKSKRGSRQTLAVKNSRRNSAVVHPGMLGLLQAPDIVVVVVLVVVVVIALVVEMVVVADPWVVVATWPDGSATDDIVTKMVVSSKAHHLTRDRYQSDVLAPFRAAEFLATRYNRVIPISLLRLDARVGDTVVFCTTEPSLRGTFEKYNNNCGVVMPTSPGINHEIIQAFSHWTYEQTEHKIMVVDCQGVRTSDGSFQLTDPAIHCNDPLRFGPTNLSSKGFTRFFSTHRCNDCCRALGLGV